VVLDHYQNSTSGSNHSSKTSGILKFKGIGVRFKNINSLIHSNKKEVKIKVKENGKKEDKENQKTK